jgi:hypothetical protein
MIESLTAVAWAFSTVKSAALALPNYYALATPVEISRADDSTNKSMEQSPEANDGLKFQTLTPDKPVVIPKKGKTEFKIGIWTTNISSTPKKFLPSLGQSYFFDVTQKRVLFDSEGIGKEHGVSSHSTNNNWISKELCYSGGGEMIQEIGNDPVLKPGESVELFHAASVYRKAEEVDVFYASGGNYCTLGGFKPGQYSASIYTYFSINSADIKTFKVRHVQAIPSRLVLVEEG